MHWEMLERNVMVNKELYIAQLNRVNEVIQLKRPHRQGQTILLYNNAGPHVAQVIKATLQELKWEGLQHSGVFSRPCTHGLLSFPLFFELYKGFNLRQ